MTEERFRQEPGRSLRDFLERGRAWTRSALNAYGEDS